MPPATLPVNMRRLLIVGEGTNSHDTNIRTVLGANEHFSCRNIPWQEEITAALSKCADDLVVLVATGHSPEAANVLKWLSDHAIATPVFVVFSTDQTDVLLQLAAKFAEDFIICPFCPEELRHRILRLLAQPSHDLEEIRQQLLEELGLTNLVGRDPVFVRIISQLPRFARSDVSVCVTGETGTGKELCARALHHLSLRHRFPFLAVDCGALPEQLFENEMFGHMRGAFTDAHRDQKGLVSIAEGGTLFLDEVDALSLAAQAKLLRFLQERTYRSLGSDHFERANVRVIVATNRDLEVSVRDRQFRSDLYFRLSVLRLRLPPLRDRRGDIELIAYAALKDCSATGSCTTFSPAAMRILNSYGWPGNVRELYNVVQRAVVACESDLILPEHLDLAYSENASSRLQASDFRSARAAAVAAFERSFVEELLRKHRGNVTHAAREAQQDRRVFGRLSRSTTLIAAALMV
jgi:DNA-binding NtrC family response regulator